MAEVRQPISSGEVFDIATAIETLRRSSRTLEFAQFTVESARNEAIASISKDAVGPPDPSAPLGTLDRLDIQKIKLDKAFQAILARTPV